MRPGVRSGPAPRRGFPWEARGSALCRGFAVGWGMPSPHSPRVADRSGGRERFPDPASQDRFHGLVRPATAPSCATVRRYDHPCAAAVLWLNGAARSGPGPRPRPPYADPCPDPCPDFRIRTSFPLPAVLPRFTRPASGACAGTCASAYALPARSRAPSPWQHGPGVPCSTDGPAQVPVPLGGHVVSGTAGGARRVRRRNRR